MYFKCLQNVGYLGDHRFAQDTFLHISAMKSSSVLYHRNIQFMSLYFQLGECDSASSHDVSGIEPISLPPSSLIDTSTIETSAISTSTRTDAPDTDHTYGKLESNSQGTSQSQKKMSPSAIPPPLAKFITHNISQPPTLQTTLQERAMLKTIIDNSASADALAQASGNMDAFHDCYMRNVAQNVGQRPEQMRNRKHGNVSSLMKKDYHDLATFQIDNIMDEMVAKFPDLFILLIHIMLPPADRIDHGRIAEIMPRLAMIYAIVLQTRLRDLSRMQRVISMCLTDNICNQKVSRAWCYCY